MCGEFWEGVKNGLFGERWWKENLRVNKATFDFLCGELRQYISKQETHLRQPVSVEKRIAVTLWKLATNVEYRTIGALFGIGRSTVGNVVLETCAAISEHLLPKYVTIPEGAKLRELVDGYEGRWGFPQAVGAIDGTHIPIIRPLHSAADYYNRKGYYSILMQAMVDYRGIFMDIHIGWPGKVHDARVFANSSLYRKAQAGTLFPNWTKTIGGVNVPLLILGDSAYPSLPWLIKAYHEHPNMSAAQKNFNYLQSRSRMVVENAFGRLKGRWRILLKRNDCHVSSVINMVATCVVLHNICELFKDDCLPEWTVEEPITSTPSQSSHTQVTAGSATIIRDAIKDYLNC